MLVTAGIVAGLGTVSVSAAEHVNFYVSQDGNDEGEGSIEDPFETIEGAKQAVRAYKEENGLPDGGICVYVREGTYSIQNTVEFTKEDSGTEESPITYRPYKNEKVIFVGGEELRVKDFKRVADPAVLERIYDKAARECIYQYDLSQISGFEYGEPIGSGASNELVVDGELMTIARYPNALSDGSDSFEKPTSAALSSESGKGITFSMSDTDRVNNWKNAKDMRIVANWVYLWSTSYDIVDSIKNGMITTQKPMTSNPSGVARFYATNLLEELDRPGEFYVDKENEKLYFYPTPNSTASSKIYISTFGNVMFNIKGASYITFREFEIPCSRGAAFTISGGNHNLIAYCNIRNLAGIGISITGGERNGAVGNYISLCNGGINVYGGDRNTLTPSYNYAENNNVERFSRISKTYRGGIHVGGCGNIVSHNEIHNALHLGMQFEGNENLIEYNEFYDLLQSVDDSGGIYAGRTWAWRGNSITHNYFHDFYGSSGGVGLGCIYFDDGLSGNSVTKNIFENIPGRAMWAEAGSDNNVENNIMINVGTPIRYADRGNSQTKLSEIDAKNKHVTSMNEVPYTSKIWTDKYPILKKINELPINAPNRVLMQNNVFVNSGSCDISAGVTTNGTVKDNITMDDPGFLDLKNGDYTLKKDASVYSTLKGFEDTHFERMGRYTEKLGKLVKDSLVMGINKACAFNDGELRQIDEGNENVMPVIRNGRTMVPVRFISEALSSVVDWNEDSKEVTITKDGNIIKMQIGNDIMTVNQKESALDSAPVIEENRVLIPLRALVEALNKKVFWDDKGLIVIGENENIFDSDTDSYLIDDLLRRIDLR